MNIRRQTPAKAAFTAPPSATPVRHGLLQRACACGQHTSGSIGECEECKKRHPSMLQRAAIKSGPTHQVQPPMHEEDRSSAQPPDRHRGAFRETRFRHSFSHMQTQTMPTKGDAASGGSVSADLPQPLDDPLHQPIIEQYRREHGLPPSGTDEEGRQVGPSDAEIKYGGLSIRSQTPASVFYVSFQNVAPPRVPDHSQANPGPNRGGANRAGYTSVNLQKGMTIFWDDAPLDSSGRMPFYIRSVNIFYRLDPIELFVSSDYQDGSCPYRVTLTHEQSHIQAFLRIFHEGRASLLQRLNSTAIPTQANPALIESADVETTQNIVGERMKQLIVLHSRDLVAEMEADRANKDAPAAYRAVYAQCSPTEW